MTPTLPDEAGAPMLGRDAEVEAITEEVTEDGAGVTMIGVSGLENILTVLQTGSGRWHL